MSNFNFVFSSGAVVRDLDTYYGITAVMQMTGSGMAPVNNQRVPYGLSDGALYQNTIVQERVVQLACVVTGSTLQAVHQVRKKIIADINNKALNNGTFILRYSGAGTSIDIPVRYDGGLEGNALDGLVEKFVIRLLAVQPFWQGTAQQSLTLASSQTLTSGGYLAYRTSALVWTAFAASGAPGAVIQHMVVTPDASTVYVATGVDVYKYTAATWSKIGTFDAAVKCLAIGRNGTTLYAGGLFTTTAAPSTGGAMIMVAKYSSGVAWVAMAGLTVPGASGVLALAADSRDYLYAGGTFTTAAGVACKGIARWTGAAWAKATNIPFSADVSALAIDASDNVYYAGTASVDATKNVEYLIVGGGGAGGGNGYNGGGGGGGKVQASTFAALIGNSYSVVVGGAGVGSSAFGITGTAGSAGSTSGGASGSGNAGGAYTPTDGGGGGGGDSAVGGASAATLGGAGGIGTLSSITGTPAYYGGGGGGSGTISGGAGGNGGGGKGGTGGNGVAVGTSGTANTGGGGGGAYNSGLVGGGGSGVVVIRYPTGTTLATGGAITYANGYTIHTFTSNDNFVLSSSVSKYTSSFVSSSALGGAFGSTVNGLAISPNGNLYAGGAFTTAGGNAANRIAVWNGTTWAAVGSGFGDGTVSSIAFEADGTPHVAGSFTLSNSIACNYAAVYVGGAGAKWIQEYCIKPPSACTAVVIDKNGQLYLSGYSSTTPTIAGSTSVANTGDFDSGALITIARSGGTTARLRAIVNTFTGKKLVFDYALLDGETFTIDAAGSPRTIYSSGNANLLGQLISNSNLDTFAVSGGTNNMLLFVDTTGSPTITATLYYYRGYWGADSVS